MRLGLFAVTLGAIVLAGCMSRVDVADFSAGRVVTDQYPSKINFLPRAGERWIEVSGSIEKPVLRRIFRQRLGMMTIFDDCRERSLGEDDVYVNGVSLYQLAMNQEEFDLFYETLPDPVTFVSRVRQDRLLESESVCAELYGNNMIGQGISSGRIRLK